MALPFRYSLMLVPVFPSFTRFRLLLPTAAPALGLGAGLSLAYLLDFLQTPPP